MRDCPLNISGKQFQEEGWIDIFVDPSEAAAQGLDPRIALMHEFLHAAAFSFVTGNQSPLPAPHGGHILVNLLQPASFPHDSSIGPAGVPDPVTHLIGYDLWASEIIGISLLSWP